MGLLTVMGISGGAPKIGSVMANLVEQRSDMAFSPPKYTKALLRDLPANSFGRMKQRKKRLTNSEHREISMAAVLSAAEFLFVTQGYSGTTTEQIGELAGLTKGSVYFYYGTKEGVLLELLNRVRANVLVPCVQVLRDNTLSPVERMTRFLEMSTKVAFEYPGSMLVPIVVSIEFAGGESEAGRRVKAGYDRLASEIQRVLELGQASGVFRSDLGSGDMARMLISICDGMMLECLRQNLRIDVHRLVRALRAVILSGLQGVSVSPVDLDVVDGPSVLDVLSGNLQAQG